MPPSPRPTGSTSTPPPPSGAATAAHVRSARPLRPLCRYIALPGGCYAGDRCKFRHSEQASKTPHQEKQTCRFYAAGYCKRGAECWYRHVSDAPAREREQEAEVAPSRAPEAAQTVEEDSDLDDLACMICYDKPLQYGLLSGCSHVFCLACMRGWRDVKDKEVGMLESGVVKACPVCRVSSRFVTPSSQFYPQGHPKKAEMVAAYKSSMARVPCRYFARSIQMNPPRPFCPYGKDCFYEHKLPTGDIHQFPHGADFYMTVHRERTQRQRRSQYGQDFELITDAIFTANMAGHSRADIQRDLEAGGFWTEMFAGFGWDVTQGPPAGVEGPLPPPPGPGRSVQEMNNIRRLLSTLANNMDGNHLEDGEDEEAVLPQLFGLRSLRDPGFPRVNANGGNGAGAGTGGAGSGGAAAGAGGEVRSPQRERGSERARTPHSYFGPRPPSPHPVAARSSPASENGPTDLAGQDDEQDDREPESRAGRSRRSSYYGPRPPSPHPTAARSTAGSVHGGDDQPPLEDVTDSDDEGSEEGELESAEEAEGEGEGRLTEAQMREARLRRFGAAPTAMTPAATAAAIASGVTFMDAGAPSIAEALAALNAPYALFRNANRPRPPPEAAIAPGTLLPTPPREPAVLPNQGGRDEADSRGENPERSDDSESLSDGSGETEEMTDEDEDEDEDDDEEEWHDPSFPSLVPNSPRGTRAEHPVTERAAFSPQNLDRVLRLQDDIRNRVRLVPDGAASRPGNASARGAGAARSIADTGIFSRPLSIEQSAYSAASSAPTGLISSVSGGYGTTTPGLRPLGSPPRPPHLRRPSLSEDMRVEWGPSSAAHEDVLGNPTMPNSAHSANSASRASRFISGLFRRDAAQERRIG